MADLSAILQELYRRIDTLPPDKAAIVLEVAKRFNIGKAAAQSRTSVLNRIGARALLLIGFGLLTAGYAALARTLNTAGRTVLFSAATVTSSLQAAIAGGAAARGAAAA